MSFDIKFTRRGFENACWIARQASRCQQAFSKPCLPSDSTCVLKALPGKLDIKRHSPSTITAGMHYDTIVQGEFKRTLAWLLRMSWQRVSWADPERGWQGVRTPWIITLTYAPSVLLHLEWGPYGPLWNTLMTHPDRITWNRACVKKVHIMFYLIVAIAKKCTQ